MVVPAAKVHYGRDDYGYSLPARPLGGTPRPGPHVDGLPYQQQAWPVLLDRYRWQEDDCPLVKGGSRFLSRHLLEQ